MNALGISPDPRALPVADYTDDPLERSLYAHDMAAVPPVIARLLLRAAPDVVARPQTIAEAATLLRHAARHRLPVTPRAAGSTAFHNAAPVYGGILVDLNALRGVVAVDHEHQTARVLAATRWKELDDALRYDWGLAVKTYPTSAPAATVGGWFSMRGLGVGSLKYGACAGLVTGAEVVSPDGEVRHLTQRDRALNWLAGAEGTLGLVASLELTLRPAPEATASYLIAFADLRSLQHAARTLAGAAPVPYHIRFADAGHSRIVRSAGFASPVPDGMHSLLVCYEGLAAEVAAGGDTLVSLARHLGGQALSQRAADEAWELRFADLRIKRAGPTLLGVEVLLPLTRLAAFAAAAQAIGRRYGVPMCVYGSVVSPEHAQPNVFFPTDERAGLPYLLSLGVIKQLHDAAGRLGGRPYGFGLWNTPFLAHAYSRSQRRELCRRKQLLDPLGIMNPGKLYDPPALLTPLLFNPAMDALGVLQRLLVRRRQRR